MFILLLVALIAGVGLSHIIVDGSLFSKWRGYVVEKYKDTKPWLVELITCYQCSGFWTGALMGLFLQPIPWSSFLHPWIVFFLAIPLYFVVTPVVIGCSTSYLSMVAAALLNWLDAPAMAAAAKKNESKT